LRFFFQARQRTSGGPGGGDPKSFLLYGQLETGRLCGGRFSGQKQETKVKRADCSLIEGIFMSRKSESQRRLKNFYDIMIKINS